MKQFFALYVKELKANRTLFLFLILLIAGLNAYGLIRIEDGLNMEEAFKQIFIWTTIAIFLAILSLPFLLAHAFNSEWNQTRIIKCLRCRITIQGDSGKGRCGSEYWFCRGWDCYWGACIY